MTEQAVSVVAGLPATIELEDSTAHGLVRQRVQESIVINTLLLSDELVNAVARLAAEVSASIRAGGKVLLFGNGGSAADATHIAAEFVGRFMFNRAPLPALSLSDNASALTAISNDYGYDLSFARQVHAFGAPGDIAIGLSTSGTSPNVLTALQAAHAKDMFTAAFTGLPGHTLANAVDQAIVIPSTSTARVQEAHMLCAHTLCELVEQDIFTTPND